TESLSWEVELPLDKRACLWHTTRPSPRASCFQDTLTGLPESWSRAKEKGLYTWWREVVGSHGLTVGNAQARASGESIGVSSPRGSGVEHFLGKEGVTGSNPVVGSKPTA